MCFRVVFLLLFGAVSCTSFTRMHRITAGEVALGLAMADEISRDETDELSLSIDSIRGTLSSGPVIMNAIKDTETGEMIATDVICASKVVARFRNAAERRGMVSVSFDISVPSALSDSKWQLKINPKMYLLNDTLPLDAIYITGVEYREGQLRGYERYNAFLAKIITDSTDLMQLRQLEIFLERNAREIFGVTQEQAMEHYRRHVKTRINDRRCARSEEMYHRYVKDPVLSHGVRLDTVLEGESGDFIYRYTHTFSSRPRLKKVNVTLHGSLFEKGEKVLELPFPEELTFYISSLSTLADQRPKYRVVESSDSSYTTELDSVYMSGVLALNNLDYKTAVTVLRPYGDYNSALAYVTADYNHTALEILMRLDDTDPKVCYLKSIVLSRLGNTQEAMKYFKLALAYDPYLEHRANLDPEMYDLVHIYKQF